MRLVVLKKINAKLLSFYIDRVVFFISPVKIFNALVQAHFVYAC